MNVNKAVQIDLDALERAAHVAMSCPWDGEEGVPGDCIKAFREVATPEVVNELVHSLRAAEAGKLQAESDLRVMSVSLAESRANDRAAMGWLADCRMAVGDCGRRTLPDFVEYLKELRRVARQGGPARRHEEMTAPARINGMAQAELEASCRKKNRYADRYTAVAMGITRSAADGIKLYTYRCPVCKGWHLTRNGRGKDGNPVLPCVENIFG